MTAVSPSDRPSREGTKRSRTRQSLLDAALAVLGESGEGFSLTEVTTRAGVSHGTFYNYFKDRDDLMAALVPYVVEEFASRAATEVRDDDPAVRFATISAHALRRAARAPQVARVALRLMEVQVALVDDGPLDYLRADLHDGFVSGRFTEAPNDATIDLVVGTLLLACRRVASEKPGDDYVIDVIQRVLMSVGITRAEAFSIAERATATAL